MRKKLVAAVLSICMCQSLLAGCGQKAEEKTTGAPDGTVQTTGQESPAAEVKKEGTLPLNLPHGKPATWNVRPSSARLTDLRILIPMYPWNIR